MPESSAFLTAYIDAWNSQDASAIAAFFDPEVVYNDHAVGVSLDINTVQGFLSGFIGRYSKGFRVTVTHVCGRPEDGMFAYEWTAEGQNEAGTRMHIPGISLIEMRGGKILRNEDYWDYAASPKAQAQGAS